MEQSSRRRILPDNQNGDLSLSLSPFTLEAPEKPNIDYIW
jgi:hypothetical protein